MGRNLYRVTLRGMTSDLGSNVCWGCPFVVAMSPNEAVELVQRYLEKEDLGFPGDRVLHSVELLAEETKYPGCRVQLFVAKE